MELKRKISVFDDCRGEVGVFLPYQTRWAEDEADVKLAEKSRRVGLSWAEAGDSVLYASESVGDDVWYIGYTKDMAREFIDDCGAWAKFYNQAAGQVEEAVLEDEDKDITVFCITFPSGNKITALSSSPRNLRGKGGRVIIDEFAFHPDPEGLLKAAIALIIWGGKIRIISTHLGENNPFNDLIKDIQAGKKPGYAHHRIDFDDALRDGLYRRICEVKGWEWSPENEKGWRQKIIGLYGSDADEELFCVPSQGSGFYLPRVIVEQCMDATIPVIRWECKTDFAKEATEIRRQICQEWFDENIQPLLEGLNKNNRHYAGLDFGRSGDLSVAIPLEELPGLKYRTPFHLELRNVPYDQQKQIWFGILSGLPCFSGAAMDSRGNGEWLGEVSMQKFGEALIAQVKQTRQWYMDIPPRYKAALEDKSVSIAKHADVLSDHRIVKMGKGVAVIPDNSKTKGTDGGQRHADSFLAYCFAWQAKDTKHAPIEFLASGEKRESCAVERYVR